MTRCKKSIFTAGLALALTALGALAQAVPGANNLPLYFESAGEPGQFLAQGRDGQVLVSPQGFQITLRDTATVKMQFFGGSPQAQIHGEVLPGKINYLSGTDAARWRTGVATSSKIHVDNLYPGISAVCYGNQKQVEYDFNVSPGASPQAIALRFPGTDKISVNERGELALLVGHHEIDQPKPVIYQMIAGARHAIAGGYQLLDSHTVVFNIGPYDRQQPLVIDPILSYATYFGGNLGEVAFAVAVNTNDGSIFVAGSTLSAKWLASGYQTVFGGGTYLGDAFVAKFDTNYNLIYLTYLGGSSDDVALGIAVNKAGNAFVGGYTTSPDFPVTTNSVPGVTNHLGGVPYYQGHYFADGFVAELDVNGAKLIYSTYLGGIYDDAIYGIAIDSADNAYVTGYTFSPNLPVKNPVAFTLIGTTNHSLGVLGCTNTLLNCNAFVAKIAARGTNLDYLTYFGGNDYDFGTGIAVDLSNNVYITGFTCSTNFPNTNGLQYAGAQFVNYSNYVDGLFDGYVAKFAQPTATNLNLIYSTFLGNTQNDVAYAIAVDSHEAAYVTGFTTSTNFYNTTTGTNANGTISYPFIQNGVTNNVIGYDYTTNVFLAKLTNNPNNNTLTNPVGLAYSVVFGGLYMDIGHAVAVDPQGNAFVTGSTISSTFPVANDFGRVGATGNGANDIFVTAFNTNCTKILYSGFIGGAGDDVPYGIAVDNQSTVYLVGQTFSANFPVTTTATNFPTTNAKYPTLDGTSDTFLLKILLTNFQTPLTIAPVKTNLVVSVTGTNAVTKMETNAVTTGVALSWLYNTTVAPEMATHVLQASTNLATTNWVTLPNTPTLTNNIRTVTLAATNPWQFFRLSP
jgi:hypothetical protein